MSLPAAGGEESTRLTIERKRCNPCTRSESLDGFWRSRSWRSWSSVSSLPGTTRSRARTTTPAMWRSCSSPAVTTGICRSPTGSMRVLAISTPRGVTVRSARTGSTSAPPAVMWRPPMTVISSRHGLPVGSATSGRWRRCASSGSWRSPAAAPATVCPKRSLRGTSSWGRRASGSPAGPNQHN